MAEEPVSKPVLWLGVGSAAVVLLAVGALVLSLAPVRGPINQKVEHGPADPRGVFRAGQAVDIWHAGKWYPGKVHSAANEQYLINYDGFSISWYEWVDASQLRARR